MIAICDLHSVVIQKSPTEIIAVLGILRAGAAYTPIDSSQPSSRIMKIVDSAGIRHVITDETSSDKFRDIKTGLIDVNKIQEIQAPDESWEPCTDPSMPVYVMFTSGSTGTPKGVIHQHRSVSGSLVECIEELHIDHSTRFMQWGSLAFDASILEVFAALVAGGCLCIPSEEERNSVLELFMRKVKVNYAWLVPSLVPQIQPENLPDLHDLSIGGEPLSKEVLVTWANRVRLHNTHGITEGGVWDILKFEMKPDDNFRNIGRGIGSLSCWITDPSDVHRLKPFGAEGELVIQSPYLAQGYLNDPQRSAIAFLDPSSVEWASHVPALKEARLYHTGDLAKFNDKGEIIFLGRKTGFVKIRGLRVDLEGVETAISSTIQTGRSAVVLSEADSDAEIVAFMETSDNIESPLPDEMSKRLSYILVDYMIPSIFVRVDKFPLTGSKRIDRQQLRRNLSKTSQKQLCSCRRGGSSKDDHEKIPDKRPIAIEISRKVSDMLTSEDATSLRGKNFSLHAVGINSIQFVSLAKWLFKEYGGKIKVEALCNLRSVCDVEDIVMDKILGESKKSENQDLFEEFVKLKAKLPLRKRTVFCTSITGFLGSQVLRTLLQIPAVGQVIGLVRTENQELAMEIVQKQAEIAQWWEPSFQNRIKILLGDLSKPQLGLDEGDWDLVFGKVNESPIDSIIHNGAKVNWMSNYAELELVNVNSTLDILSGMSNMPSPCSLVYVSGGYLSNSKESPTELANKLSRTSGYDQTKFMSERLVSEYNKNLDYQKLPAHKARTVLPAFIVGTQKEDIAHPEDFLWRFVFTIGQVGAMSYNLSRVAVTGVDQVSSLISDVALHPDQYRAGTLACGDGVSASTFCSILSKKLKKHIQFIDHDRWMKILRDDVDNPDFEHPFLPVLEWVEDNQWHMADPKNTSKESVI
ncbi:hypothetical protein N7490_005334 [Penicillium lividum]|nr:hypothetical protein N7490_005334 [Penicillium lividum]